MFLVLWAHGRRTDRDTSTGTTGTQEAGAAEPHLGRRDEALPGTRLRGRHGGRDRRDRRCVDDDGLQPFPAQGESLPGPRPGDLRAAHCGGPRPRAGRAAAGRPAPHEPAAHRRTASAERPGRRHGPLPASGAGQPGAELPLARDERGGDHRAGRDPGPGRGPPPYDPETRYTAAAVQTIRDTLFREAARRTSAGESAEAIHGDLRALADRLFDALERGVGAG